MQSSYLFRRSFVVAFMAIGTAGYFACAPGSDGVSTDDGTGQPGTGGDGTGNGSGNTGGKAGNTGGGNVGAGGSPIIIEFADALTMPPHDGGAGNNNESPVDALEACGSQKFEVKREPPDVMLVLDRSGSMMRNAAGDPAAPTKWGETTAAIKIVLQATEADVQWGAQLYPTCVASGMGFECAPTPCTVSGLNRAPALNQHTSLFQMISTSTPKLDTGATPTRVAVQTAVKTLKELSTPNPKYILLATDGLPNCLNHPGGLTGGGMDDEAGAIEAVKAAAQEGFPVFVVGIATASSKAHATLNQMAVEGGRALDGDVKYFSVANKDQLVSALTSIAASTIPCVMPLEMPPQDDAVVLVDVDGKRLPESETDGWSFTPGRKALKFNGLACTKLQKGEFKNTEISFHCPGKPLPPPPPPAL